MGRKRKLEDGPVLISTLLNTQAPMQQLLVEMRQTTVRPSGSLAWTRKLAGDELHKYDRIVTPYGPIVETQVIVGKTKPLTVKCVNPFAFLWHAVELSEAFLFF